MKIAVIGANGQLGTDLVACCASEAISVVGLTHSEIEIASLESVRQVLAEAEADVVINTAAMHNVESCEREPLRAYEINALGARNLAMVAAERNTKLCHVSTDYVFNGKKSSPYTENDVAIPLNIYGNTKLAGEAFVLAQEGRCFVVRTSALYGKSRCRAKCGNNFVELMLKLGAERDEVRVVDDEFVSPTPTVDLAQQILALVKSEHFGLYHATSEGSCSWYQFAKAIFELSDARARLKVAGPNEFPAKVPRPKYSVLENQGLKRHGLNRMTEWRVGLKAYLALRPTLQNAPAQQPALT
jgi:dTDP-4-dehydrorhamnose reductase